MTRALGAAAALWAGRGPWVASAALTLLAFGCGASDRTVPERLDDAEFSRLVRELSEDGGYFWSNNFISNETSYQHVMEVLERRELEGGAYIGVGPNQNFTYIAAVRPKMAFIVDIRRQNMVEHLLFKSLMERSDTREEYLSRLLARRPEQPLPKDAPIEDIVAHLKATPAAESVFDAELEAVLSDLERFPDLGLGPEDHNDLASVFREFYRQGLEIKYDSWRSFFFPSLEEFVLQTDLEGRQRNWLASHEDFAFVRDMARDNRIVPVTGNFAGPNALRRVGRYIESKGLEVSAFYLSNVEFYLFRQRKWQEFVENVETLPVGPSSVFIRAYANLHRPHPRMVDDHITITLVQNIQDFLRSARAGRYRNLWDVVTSDEL